MKSVTASYLAKIEAGELEKDAIQLELAGRLDQLAQKLANHKLASKSSSLGWLFGGKKDQGLKGLYIWGGVGRGKSMMMDLFFATLQANSKKRIHFHDFMINAQARIEAHRKAFGAGKTKQEDPMPPVATELAKQAAILCFDEFAVNDIADAMILGRLFSGLYDAGSIIIATSNVAPDDLYKDGLNRQLFMPFVALLKENCDIFELDGDTDYRLEKISDKNTGTNTTRQVYFAPLGEKNASRMNEAWQETIQGDVVKKTTLKIKGRKIDIEKTTANAAWFSFSQLCEAPLGSEDYLAIARKFSIVFIENVPLMGLDQRSPAKRFINLIDTLYDQKIRLVMSAAASPHALYAAKHGVEAFEFDRTASRLIEMQSADYWLQAPKHRNVNL